MILTEISDRAYEDDFGKLRMQYNIEAFKNKSNNKCRQRQCQ